MVSSTLRHLFLDFVLDIGWGGLSLCFAGQVGADIKGVTLSRQWQAAKARPVDRKIPRPPIFLMRDYCDQLQTVDSGVSAASGSPANDGHG
jgi:cyclopropane fatty-acyl-phospholipid synthase-like methyltransferase